MRPAPMIPTLTVDADVDMVRRMPRAAVRARMEDIVNVDVEDEARW